MASCVDPVAVLQTLNENKTPCSRGYSSLNFRNKSLAPLKRLNNAHQLRVCVVSALTRTCKQCKKQYVAEDNNASACRFHTAHYGGETKRKFESVHTGGTMNTPDGGKVVAYWHCCANQDPFDPGCQAGPHSSYDD